MMKRSKLFAALIAFILVFTSVTIAHSAEDDVGRNTVVNFAINDSGYFELSGYTDNPDNLWVTILLTDIEVHSASELNSHVMYINQIDLGNNDAFYISASLAPKWSGSDYVLKLCVGGDTRTYTGNLGEFTNELLSVPDNCMRIGNDIYSLTAPQYTPNNIVASLSAGGNKVFYKIGGYWFNVLEEAATGYDYFTVFNAVPDNVWHYWNIEHYYYDESMMLLMGG